MPKKKSSWGKQEYIPAGNGDASGEYADEMGGNIHVFSKFKKPEGKVVSQHSFDDLEKDLEEYIDDFELEFEDLEEIVDEIEETTENNKEKLSIEINEPTKTASSIEEFIQNVEKEIKETDAAFLKQTLINNFKEELDIKKIEGLNDKKIIDLSIALNVLEDKEKFFKTLTKDKDAFFDKIYQNDLINKNQVWKSFPQTPDEFLTSLDKKIEYFQIYDNLEKTNALKELKNSDEFKAWKTEYDELNAAYGYDFSKYQKLVDKYYNYGNAYSQKAKDEAFWFKTVDSSSKKFSPYAQKVINEWQSKDPKSIEMIKDYTGSYSSINHPLRNFDYPHKTSYPSQSKQKQKEFIDHVEGITKVLDSSTYDFNCWVQRGVNQLSLGSQMLNSGYSQEELNKLVGTKIQDQGFVSCGSHKGGGFSTHSIIMNIYCPKGTKMLYVKDISHYKGENETIIQRGYTYKITKVEKSGGKIYLDCEVILGTDKNKYNKKQLEEIKEKHF